MSSDMLTNLMNQGKEIHEYKTYKERDRENWGKRAQNCPAITGIISHQICGISGQPCCFENCFTLYWIRT